MSLAQIVGRIRPSSETARSPLAAREARVSLLPPELHAVEGHRRLRRRFVAGVAGIAVVVCLGVSAAAVNEVGAQVEQYQSAQRTLQLTHQIARYAAVAQMQQQVQLGQAAVRVGSSTAINWKSYQKRIDAVTPDSFDISSIQLDSASPVASFPQGTSPIDAPRVGAVVLTATASSIDDVPAWLNGLATLPGFADASPSVTDNSATSYTVIVTMHITDGAYITPVSEGIAK